MKKSIIVKVVVLSLSLVLAVMLFNFPKVVVEDEESHASSETNVVVNKGSDASMSAHTEVDTLQQRIILSLKKEMANAEELENYLIFADSLCVIYRKQTKFDSVALVKEQVVQKRKDGEAVLDVANAWFDAFETIGGKRQIEFGEKSSTWFQKLDAYPQFKEIVEVKQAVLSVKLNALKGLAPMEGIRQLKSIVGKNTDNLLAHRYLGEFYLQVSAGDVSKLQTGISHFEHILKVNPNDVTANLNLVEAYMALPDVRKAKFHLERLEDLVGDDKFFSEFIETKQKEIKSL